jgi:Protein of unknown function (DUF1269)
MAIGGGLAALMGKIDRTGSANGFRNKVRDMVKPGTSAPFLVVEKVTPDGSASRRRRASTHAPAALVFVARKGGWPPPRGLRTTLVDWKVVWDDRRS